MGWQENLAISVVIVIFGSFAFIFNNQVEGLHRESELQQAIIDSLQDDFEYGQFKTRMMLKSIWVSQLSPEAYQTLQAWEISMTDTFGACEKEFEQVSISDTHPVLPGTGHGSLLIYTFSTGEQVITRDGLVRCYAFPLDWDSVNVSCESLCVTKTNQSTS